MMKKQEIAAFIEETLKELFPSPAIPLLHSDAYTLLIAVLLSAQCTDERVNQVTPQLFALANTPEQMITLDVAEIVQIIRPCGLSGRKGKAIWDLSKILIDKHHGKVPASFEALEELPGVGHKTASVVMSQAFHRPAFPVDTHIHRCAKRWGLSSGTTVEQTEKDLKRCFAKEKWNALHLRIIYYARKYCPARGHRIELCPICKKLSESGS